MSRFSPHHSGAPTPDKVSRTRHDVLQVIAHNGVICADRSMFSRPVIVAAFQELLIEDRIRALTPEEIALLPPLSIRNDADCYYVTLSLLERVARAVQVEEEQVLRAEDQEAAD